MLGICRKPVLLAAVAVLGTSVCAGLVSSAGQAASAMSLPGSVFPPNPSSNSELTGVSAVSSTDVWAVGWYHDASDNQDIPLIARWNGTRWRRLATPGAGPEGSVLTGVSALSATDAWAVGYQNSGPGIPGQTLTWHWNGTAWSQVPSPNPSPRDSELSGVTAISPTDAWAVGYYESTNPDSLVDYSLALHWNGTTWSTVKTPDPGRSFTNLYGVSAASATDAWAVGQYGQPTQYEPHDTLTVQGNGTTWSKVSSPSPAGRTMGDNELQAISTLSPTDA